jgi:hypothetical protein
MGRTGDWKKLKNIMRKYDQRIMKNCTVALMRAGVKLESTIKNRIIDGKGMGPLHGFTIEEKGSSKPLIDEGDLLGSVGLRFLAKDAVFVGVHRKARDGTDIAAIHEREEGTRIKVTPKMRAYLHARGFHLKPETDELFIPGRPFIKPSYRDFRERGIAKELFTEAVEKTLKGE